MLHMQSKESGDIYSTQEPHAAFHRRITFCLDIHNEAVKAMRFAPDAHKQSQVSPPPTPRVLLFYLLFYVILFYSSLL